MLGGFDIELTKAVCARANRTCAVVTVRQVPSNVCLNTELATGRSEVFFNFQLKHVGAYCGCCIDMSVYRGMWRMLFMLRGVWCALCAGPHRQG